MKKKLVSAENITDFFDAGATEIYVDSSMIMTSGAKDYLREKKIKLIYSKKPAAVTTPPSRNSACVPADMKTVVTKIVSILRKDFQVTDAGMVERVTQKVLCGLKSQ